MYSCASEDFLVVKDLAPILDRINDHDLVSYTTAGQSCQRGTFSSLVSSIDSPGRGVKLDESARNQWEKRGQMHFLGGGFKHFLFSPLFGEMIQFD